MYIPTDSELLAHIEGFIEANKARGMNPRQFGMATMRDPGLLISLKKTDRSLSLKNARKVVEFIAAYQATESEAA